MDRQPYPFQLPLPAVVPPMEPLAWMLLQEVQRHIPIPLMDRYLHQPPCMVACQ